MNQPVICSSCGLKFRSDIYISLTRWNYRLFQIKGRGESSSANTRLMLASTQPVCLVRTRFP